MSQYPPPNVHYGMLTPMTNRGLYARAGILMCVCAALVAALGLCVVFYAAPRVPEMLDQAPPAQREQLRQQFQQIEAQGMTVQGLYAGMGYTVVGAGALAALLAIFVLRGSHGGAIGAAIYTAVLLLLCGCVSFAALAPAGPLGCMFLLPLGLLVLLMIWLVQAIRGGGAAAQMQQWQQQMWMQQQAWQQQGYSPQQGLSPPVAPPASGGAMGQPAGQPPGDAAPGAMPDAPPARPPGAAPWGVPQRPPNDPPGGGGSGYGYAQRPPTRDDEGGGTA